MFSLIILNFDIAAASFCDVLFYCFFDLIVERYDIVCHGKWEIFLVSFGRLREYMCILISTTFLEVVDGMKIRGKTIVFAFWLIYLER